MATTAAQQRWREKNKDVKSQLNVMAKRVTHDSLAKIADDVGLKGKAEAVAFCAYVTESLHKKAARDATTYLYLDAIKAAYRRERDKIAP